MTVDLSCISNTSCSSGHWERPGSKMVPYQSSKKWLIGTLNENVVWLVSFLMFFYVVAHGYFCRRRRVHGYLIETPQCCCSLLEINSGWAETGKSSIINILENLLLSNYREGLLLITVGISAPLPNRCSRGGSVLSSGFLNDRVRYILAFHFKRAPHNDTF